MSKAQPKENNLELIQRVSAHPIYGIIDHYGRMNIRGEWYIHDPVHDRLIRSPNIPLQQELFDAPTQ